MIPKFTCLGSRLALRLISLVFLTGAASGQTGLPFDIRPSVENRVSETPAKDLSVASASSGITEETTTAGIRMVDAEIGYSFSSLTADFSFGDVIAPPLRDLEDNVLTATEARNYWRRRPLTKDDEVRLGGVLTKPIGPDFVPRYYYSKHREEVLASYTGNVTINWVTAKPKWNGDDGVITQTYTIGLATNRTVRQLFWTEHNFKAPRVSIPSGVVEKVELIYNNRVPKLVGENERIIPDGVPETTVKRETVVYNSEQELLGAYNVEGMILVEYLGALRPDGVDEERESLGVEVIDVRRTLRPTVVESLIGEQILPSDRPGSVLGDIGFTPVVQKGVAENLVAQHFIDNRQIYYGVRENLQSPRVEFYWLETGTHSIRWPKYRNHYFIEWPEEIEDFAGVFVRPDMGSEDEDLINENTRIDLIATNSPELVFQDDPTGNEASLDFRFHLSVTLRDDERNRSLIRFTSGNNFRYVRLYSATDSHLRGLDAPGENFNPDNPRDFHIARNVVVGQRLEPPHASLLPGGYIDPTSGDAYQTDVYTGPFGDGGIAAANLGAIIPVNALSGNDKLRVWWFRTLEARIDQADLFSSVAIPTVVGDYTISYPSNAPEIVMASNAGTGELDEVRSQGRIYYQNDPLQPGYNPNEEHALFLAGRAYALRDDLNLETSSQPFVLLAHPDAEGRADMSVFKVFREKIINDDRSHPDSIVFDYPAVAGRLLQAPLPLSVMPQPILDDGFSKNEEVTPPNLDPVKNGLSAENLTHYDRFTFEDRKGNTWVYRGPHDPDAVVAGSEPKLSFQYHYPTQPGFDFPGRETPPVGTIVPFLRPLGSTEDPVTGTPLNITYTPEWPAESPVLHFGETLAKPKFGLPQILGQSAVQLVYQQSIALDFDAELNSVVLHDSTINRSALLSDIPSLEAIPGSVNTERSGAELYFNDLPTHLADRVYFDGLVGTQGALIFEGEFRDEAAGEDYLVPNTFSAADVETMKDLCDANDPKKAGWDALIANMRVDPIYQTLDENENVRQITYAEYLDEQGIARVIGQDAKASYGPTELPQIVSPDQAVNGYLLSAIGGGSGYVTIAVGNGEINSPEGEPVSLYVFRVGEQLYRGELKPLVADNPLSENVTVLHTGDFAGDAANYEFEWRKAPPDGAGLAPAVFTFVNRHLPGFPTDLKFQRNISGTPGVAEWGGPTIANLPSEVAIHQSGGDRTVPGLRLSGSIDFDALLAPTDRLDKVYLSLKLGDDHGAIVKVNGTEALRYRALGGQDAQILATIPAEITPQLTNGGGFVVFEVPARNFKAGANEIEVLFNTTRGDDFAVTLDLRVGIQIKKDAVSSSYLLFATEAGKSRHLVSGSGIDTLGDNYYIMRYRPLQPEHPFSGDPPKWSDWTQPALVEGWIKRVLAGLNPFNQRITDFFENAVDSNTGILTSAGTRWEGDVALTLGAVQEVGLIELYETVLKRGINLSIDGTPAVDYAPANDALLLAAGYLNDLYVALGNEAFADAANPTVTIDTQAIGVLGTAVLENGFEETFRSTSTARFAFQGQVPTLLDEELGLLRGRDDFLAPSIQTPPVYNRMFWNYTRGIDAGELVYALNYNIREQNDEVADGKIDAADAQRMFPQAHGDAYGHYLTAVKNYYRLLTDPQFTWGTRIEAVNVLGQPVSIDYFDERKFAASASALANTASQIVDLERRKAFQSGQPGWESLGDGRVNLRTGNVRHWGADDWASRAGQGTYFNWVLGNAILPDLDEVNEGIQKIDRSTVPELNSIAKAGQKIQLQIEAADARINPLDLSKDDLLLDISPSELADGKTHFEQLYERAVAALQNAHAIFDRAADSTRLLRFVENQSQNLTKSIDDQELSYLSELYDAYGEPYRGDVGPGKIYPQGYGGPDLLRYMLIDRPYDVFTKEDLFKYDDSGSETFTFNVRDSRVLDFIQDSKISDLAVFDTSEAEVRTVSYTLRDGEGPYIVANPQLGKRPALGSLQKSLNEVRKAEEEFYLGLKTAQSARLGFDRNLGVYRAEIRERQDLRIANKTFSNAKFGFKESIAAMDEIEEAFERTAKTLEEIAEKAEKAVISILGTSNDVGAPIKASIATAVALSKAPITASEVAIGKAKAVANTIFTVAEKAVEISELAVEDKAFLRTRLAELRSLYLDSVSHTVEVDGLHLAYIRAMEEYRTELADADFILANRETFRKRAAAAVQGYRTRDIAFRVFRNEALEEYQTLLDWASKYAFLAAQAYDYETGLLGSKNGQAFLGKIVSARAIGVLDDAGRPMIAASENGDPGLSGLLAKLKADYDVVKGRLGFNNPETNGTTLSLRREFFRIPDGPEGDIAWQQVLEGLVKENLLTDAHVAGHALQLGGAEATPQPGFLIDFPSVIEPGRNFFGKDLLGGDSHFSVTSFATKISSLGVVFEGYQGMAPCLICQNGPGDPTHNHDDALSATPYVFLIPAGTDTLRAPPLGDGDILRHWSVKDYAMPLPFDLGSSDPSTEAVREANGNLRENFRSPRRHPAFRATDRADFFYTGFADDYTSSRLIGRSVWNSNWKLAIPARDLFSDEQTGIARFIRTVKDIKLHLKTYSYSGN